MAIEISKQTIDEHMKTMERMYLSDEIPWVVGFSGGKDSWTVTQQNIYMLLALPPEKRHKKIHIISTDTLVEQPIVKAWVNANLKLIQKFADENGLPVEVHRLTPEVSDSFWVNLIGRGYASPRKDFRWCTQRLKINPSNNFIKSMVNRHGSATVVLGTRKAESRERREVMEKYEAMRTRELLSPNGSLPNSWVFSPIEEWDTDNVWMYLMLRRNPWGADNKDLLTIYRSASDDTECPLVVDESTASCGNSRFGCFVCTMVSEDKSLAAMIQNDEEKEWMLPLLLFRDEFAPRNEDGKIDDYEFRDFRRTGGGIKLYNKSQMPIHGPYTRERREYLLKRLLEVQQQIQEGALKYLGEAYELITEAELHEIRRIWVMERNEFCDSVPRIYREVMGEDLPNLDHSIELSGFGQEEFAILKEMCGDDYVRLDLMASIIGAEGRSTVFGQKKGVIQQIEDHLKRCSYESEEDAAIAKRRQNELKYWKMHMENPESIDDLSESESDDDAQEAGLEPKKVPETDDDAQQMLLF